VNDAANNQPSKTLTNGGVRRKLETSYLVRFSHSCVINALLEVVNGALKWNCGFAYANGFASQQKALNFQARVTADIRGVTPSDSLSFALGFWLVFPGVEHRSVRVVLAEGLWDLGGWSLQLKSSVMGRRAVPLSSLCPDIRLTTEEKHGKPQSGQPSSHRTARCTDLAVFWGTASPGLPDVRSPRFPRWLQSALGRHRCLPSCLTKGFPASDNFD
jgi:hypothetical protein